MSSSNIHWPRCLVILRCVRWRQQPRNYGAADVLLKHRTSAQGRQQRGKERQSGPAAFGSVTTAVTVDGDYKVQTECGFLMNEQKTVAIKLTKVPISLLFAHHHQKGNLTVPKSKPCGAFPAASTCFGTFLIESNCWNIMQHLSCCRWHEEYSRMF